MIHACKISGSLEFVRGVSSRVESVTVMEVSVES